MNYPLAASNLPLTPPGRQQRNITLNLPHPLPRIMTQSQCLMVEQKAFTSEYYVSALPNQRSKRPAGKEATAATRDNSRPSASLPDLLHSCRDAAPVVPLADPPSGTPWRPTRPPSSSPGSSRISPRCFRSPTLPPAPPSAPPSSLPGSLSLFTF
jgi:hypothetical protein